MPTRPFRCMTVRIDPFASTDRESRTGSSLAAALALYLGGFGCSGTIGPQPETGSGETPSTEVEAGPHAPGGAGALNPQGSASAGSARSFLSSSASDPATPGPEPFLRRVRPAEGSAGPVPGPAGAAARRLVRLHPAEGGFPSQIRMADGAGGGDGILTRFPGVEGEPVLHPDGRSVVFAARTGLHDNTELFLVHDDGTGLVRLTRHGASDVEPRFDAEGHLLWTTTRWGVPPRRATADLALTEAPEGQAGICAEDARRHVYALAAEEMEGRLAGTLGDALAESYVAGCFRRFGLQPGGDEGTWFQRVEFTAEMRLGTGNALSVRIGSDLLEARLGEDFQPVRFTKNAEVKAEAVATGFGIVLPDGSEDDYAGWQVGGRVAVALDGSPEGWGKTHRAHRESAGIRGKAEAAAKKGATALLVIGDIRRDAVGRGGAGETARVPVVRVAKAFWDRVLATAGRRDVPLDVSLRTEVVAERRWTANVVGLWPGETGEAVVIGAHLDHLGFGLPGASLGGVLDRVHPGADDNASGVAGLLEVAQAVAATGRPLRRTVVFVGFAGEELGFLGSSRYVARPAVPIERTAAMVNLDMVGRAGTGGLQLQGTGTSPLWEALETRLREQASVKVSFRRSGLSASDHSPFYAQHVPVLFFFTGLHKEYHRTSDTADRLDAEGLAEVARWACEAVTRAASVPERPVFVETKPPPAPRGGKRAVLGIVPDFFSGEPGLRIVSVVPGGPADRAGLRAEDRVVRLGSEPVGEPDDLLRALASHRPDEEVDVEVRRSGEVVTAKVRLGAQGE